MKVSLLICACIISFTNTYSQSTDSITVKTGFVTTFKQNGVNLTPGRLLNIMKSNTEAYKEMKVAKSNYTVAYITSIIGGGLIGWPIGAAIAGGNANWTLAAIGGGVALLGIPFSSAYLKHAKNAVHIYNSGLTHVSKNNIELKIGLVPNSNRIGLQMNF